MLDLARRHGLVVFSDEIYDQILYDDAVHVATASLAPDLLCMTFNGLSKAYRLAGFRSGWAGAQRAHRARRQLPRGPGASSRTCGCAPTCRRSTPSQTALGGRHGIDELVLPGGRLRDQRDTALELLEQIPGVTCVRPKGALYLFPRLDPDVYHVEDDQKLVLDLLREQNLLVVQGTGFNWPDPDHLRLVTLPRSTTCGTRSGGFRRSSLPGASS